MKNMIKTALLASSIALTCGCTNMHFDNSNTSAGEQSEPDWHHNVVFGLIEVSDPVDVKEQCGNKDWNSVHTQISFINGLAGALVGVILPGVWQPKTAQVTCANEGKAN